MEKTKSNRKRIWKSVATQYEAEFTCIFVIQYMYLKCTYSGIGNCCVSITPCTVTPVEHTRYAFITLNEYIEVIQLLCTLDQF